MKKVTMVCLIFAVAIIWGSTFKTLAQERTLEPSEGFVNEVIYADTANGAQLHNVYIFHRGATYYFNGTIKNNSYAITLKAEDGSGPLPVIRNFPDGSGTLQKFIQSGDDAYLYNLYINGMGPDLTTMEPDPFYSMNGILVQAGASGKEFIVDGCILNNAGQTIIRSNSGARKVLVTNTIIANSGQLSRDNIGNGRAIDFRNGITDTIIFRNCTMVNLYDRIFRHYGAAANTATAYIDYIEMDHNTIVNNTGAYGFFFLGDISGSVKITNNLFVNPMTLGVDTADHQRFAEVDAIGEMGDDGFPIFPLIIDQPNTLYAPTFTMSNNVITYDQTVTDYMTTNGVKKAPVFTPRVAAMVTNADNAFVETDYVSLKNVPPVMIEVMNWYRPHALESLGGGMITTADVDMHRESIDYWLDTLDCSYTTDNSLFIGSDGSPVGSTVWNSTITDVDDVNTLPTEFTLSNNYPNPFNPSTKIQFSLPVSSKVTLTVYNLLGQEIARLVDGELSAGSHSVDFNAAGLSSGVYVYRIKAVNGNGKDFIASNKMTLLK